MGFPRNMQRISCLNTGFAYAFAYSSTKMKDVVRVACWHTRSCSRYRVYNPPKPPIDKRFLQDMRLWDNSYTHYRITRNVWDALVLYRKLEEKDDNPYAGLTLNQFIRKMVPKDRRYLEKR